MDVRLSPEQVALRDAAVQLLSRLAPKTVADLDDADRAAKLDSAVAAAGWRELRTATDDGTPWASGVECAIVAEELGRHLADTPFIGPTLAAELGRLTSTIGELPVSSAGFGGGVDLTRPSGEVDRSLLIGAGALAPDDRARWTALGLALTCADLVGVMRGAVDLATEYASARVQYGVAVGSFQAVQHMLADAFVAMEGSRSVALHAAWAVDALPPDDALDAASVAKAYCSRAARMVCETAIQVHGGIGNTWDCLAHVYLRRALLSIDLFGGVGPSLARVMEHRGIEGGGDGLR
jgi:alkylation response protein AidB-like acyl-CoA dehydrogenase